MTLRLQNGATASFGSLTDVWRTLVPGRLAALFSDRGVFVTLRQQAQLAWRLARRELRGGVAGFRVFLACLTLGVAAISMREICHHFTPLSCPGIKNCK